MRPFRIEMPERVKAHAWTTGASFKALVAAKANLLVLLRQVKHSGRSHNLRRQLRRRLT